MYMTPDYHSGSVLVHKLTEYKFVIGSELSAHNLYLECQSRYAIELIRIFVISVYVLRYMTPLLECHRNQSDTISLPPAFTSA